jgi:hypothetical protein
MFLSSTYTYNRVFKEKIKQVFISSRPEEKVEQQLLVGRKLDHSLKKLVLSNPSIHTGN